MYRKAGRGRSLDLCDERAVHLALGNAGMAVRIAGDADLADAAALRQAAFDHLARMVERAGGCVAIAADDQEAPDPGCVGEAGEVTVERIGAGEIPRGEMRHRLEPARAQPL